MLKLYYTGAKSYKATQTMSGKSLGGYISDTAIPNDIKNSLFANLGELKLWTDTKVTEYIGIAGEFFYFDDSAPDLFSNLTFNLTENVSSGDYSGIFTYKIGLGPIGGNQSQGFYMEQISQSKAKPYYLSEEFVDLVLGEDTIFQKIASDSAIGIWISRTFDPERFNAMFNENSDYWATHITLPKLEFKLNLKISSVAWVEVP